MILLIAFAFLAGIVTILSPCILPILPIVLSSSVDANKKRPIGIIIGFIASFTFFTLALSEIVKRTGLSADALRIFSIVVVIVFGLSLLIEGFRLWMEGVFGALQSKAKAQDRLGFYGGILIGLSIGLLWTPCVGPILASVIVLAASNTVDSGSVFITFAYALGTAIPMFIILVTGRRLLNRIPGLVVNTARIQRVFGVLMIVIGIAIFFNFDRAFQTYVLKTFPKYGTGLTALEDNLLVRRELNKRKTGPGSGVFTQIAKDLNIYPAAPELIPGGKWFNSDPLTIKSLRGKVVLVDFWTYTCINCIRTLPYVEGWYKKYANKGLVIIGVHTPEFEFEKNPDNVAKALKDFGITYPVMQDNNYETWNVYNNQYWPAKYFIDRDGKIRSTHFGEGNYDESEKMIQELLMENGASVTGIPINTKTYTVEAITPETYLGYSRMERFASGQSVVRDKSFVYTIPPDLPDDQFAYGGAWIVGGEEAQPEEAATLSFNFASKDMYLVMRPKDKLPGAASIFLDGIPVSAQFAGKDVKEGMVHVTEDRLYHLIHLASPGRHLIQITFLDSNLGVYAFTFG